MAGASSKSAGAVSPWIPLAVTLLTLIALAPLPYGYYLLLRLSLGLACVYYILKLRTGASDGHRLALGGLAVLYNSLMPIHLGSKSLWTIVNVVTVLYLWALYRTDHASEGREAAERRG